MKIGIFGGSFNPPHKMHKDIADSLIKQGYVDKVIYVPTGNSYDKPSLISGVDRYNMLNIMCKEDYLSVSDYELSDNLVSTYQTLDHFKNKSNEIYFILGSDNLSYFDEWKNFEYILSKYKLLVILRGDDKLEELMKKYSKYKDKIIFCNVKANMISSSLLRKGISNNDDFVSKNIDGNVLKYIKEKRLYR